MEAIARPDNRELLTSVECVYAAEDFIASFIIIQGVNILV